jgi:hypothetical protein
MIWLGSMVVVGYPGLEIKRMAGITSQGMVNPKEIDYLRSDGSNYDIAGPLESSKQEHPDFWLFVVLFDGYRCSEHGKFGFD